MREYGKLLPTFWTRGSGRALRGQKDAQILAAYLFSCPASSMLGLYYLAVPTIAHDTGLSAGEVEAAFGVLALHDVAHFDPTGDLVWVVSGLRIGTAPRLQPNDNRVKGLARELEAFGNHAFVRAILDRYGESHCLTLEGVEPEPLTPSEGLGSPFEAPSKPGAGAGAEQEQSRSRPLRSPPPTPSDRREAKRSAKAKAGPRPEDWTLTAALVTWGRTVGFDRSALEAHAAAWKNHHDATGSLFVNWDASFRTWVLKQRGWDVEKGIERGDLGPEPPPRAPPPRSQLTLIEQLQADMAEQEAQRATGTS